MLWVLLDTQFCMQYVLCHKYNNLFHTNTNLYIDKFVLVVLLPLMLMVHSISGPILTNFGPNKCEMLLLKIVFYAQLDASTDKLLTYNVLCTPKATVMHAFINIIFSKPGVKSHHPLGIKTPNEGYFSKHWPSGPMLS